MPGMELHERVCLVTGGGSGIGKATALAMAEQGAHVVITDIDGEAAQGVADIIGGVVGGAIGSRDNKAVALAHDVTSQSQWQAVIGYIADRFDRLDVLVNNAGIFIRCSITEMSLDDWRHQSAVNLDGVFLGTKHAIPLMQRTGGGSIINLSSVAGLRGSALVSGYCATKGGVRLFTKAAAKELVDSNIRVNSVHPGIIATPIWDKVTDHNPNLNAMDPNEVARDRTPIGVPAQPEQVADGIVFLASDRSSYMTGSELVIDGAMSA